MSEEFCGVIEIEKECCGGIEEEFLEMEEEICVCNYVFGNGRTRSPSQNLIRENDGGVRRLGCNWPRRRGVDT